MNWTRQDASKVWEVGCHPSVREIELFVFDTLESWHQLEIIQETAESKRHFALTILSHSHSALGGYYRRMRAKLGAPAAVTAMAHKLARIIYAMLKGQTEYQDPGGGYYEEQARQRAIKNLKRKANQLGFQLTEEAAS